MATFIRSLQWLLIKSAKTVSGIEHALGDFRVVVL